MSQPVLSTYKILMHKSMNHFIDESWIDWAIEMMEAGFESENLYILAGQTKPYNQFELQDLTSKVFNDLNLDYSDRDLTIKNYVYYLINTTLNDPVTYLNTLRILTDICRDQDFDDNYKDFYFLYYAKDELKDFDHQFYWDGANRENIDIIISAKFNDWIKKYELEKAENI